SFLGTPQHKLFEAEMLRQMCRHLKPNGPLEFATRLGDGMERKTDRFGRQITVHMYKMPSDFMAWTTDGRIVLVEAKHLSDGTSLSVVPAKTKGSGLHEHQMRSLVSAQT